VHIASRIVLGNGCDSNQVVRSIQTATTIPAAFSAPVLFGMPRSYPFEGGFTGEDFRYLGKSDISCTFPSLTAWADTLAQPDIPP